MATEIAIHRDARSTVVRRLEDRYNKPIDEILDWALNKAGTVRGAAKLLDEKPGAIQHLVYRFAFRSRTSWLRPVR